jgi:hypothetical protein
MFLGSIPAGRGSGATERTGEQMADETHKGNSLRWLVLLVLAIPLLYVLSLGPAAYMVERTDMCRAVADVACRPVIWLHRNTPLRKPIDAYDPISASQLL